MRTSIVLLLAGLMGCGAAETHGLFTGPSPTVPDPLPPPISFEAFGPTTVWATVTPTSSFPTYACSFTFGFKLKGGPDSTKFVLDSAWILTINKLTNGVSLKTRLITQDVMKLYFGATTIPTGGSFSRNEQAITINPFGLAYYIFFHTNTGQRQSLSYSVDCLAPPG